MGTDLLLHVPKRKHYVYPFGSVRFVNFMPVGLIPIAAYAADHGAATEIIHLGLEELLNNKYKVDEDIKRCVPKVIGISLHWHHSSFDAINLAKHIKQSYESIFIVLGGYTASFFARQILEQFPFVDGIIRGEGEVPWLVLLQEINGRRNLHNVPNLSWKKNDRIVENENSYVCGESFLTSLDFARFELVKNSRYLPGLFWIFLRGNDNFNDVLLKRKIGNTFYLPVSRGCNYNCFYCGGGKDAVRIISGRDKPSLINPQKLIFYTKKALEAGFTRTGLSLDANLPRAYMGVLFDEIIANNMRDKFWFDFYGLPPEWMIEALTKTFYKDTGLNISLDCADENYRRKIKTVFFSNEEFFGILRRIKKSGFRLQVFFTNNLPGENNAMRHETKKMIKEIKHIYPKTEIFFQNYDVEPASPIYLSPDEFGVELRRKSFMDYYNDHSRDKIDSGVLEKNGDGSVKKQFPMFQKGIFAGIIKLLIATPVAVLCLNLYFYVLSVKIRKLKKQIG